MLNKINNANDSNNNIDSATRTAGGLNYSEKVEIA